MSLAVDIGWLTATLLVCVRVASATMIAPVLGPSQVPATARVLLVLGLSAFMVSAVPADRVGPLGLGPFLAAVLGEASLGLVFAFGFVVPYAATQVAGRALDVQVGFGAAAVLNPATRAFSPLLGSVLGMLLIATFLAADGHLVLIKALATSLAAVPPGVAPLQLDAAAILKHSAATFVFGLILAAPIMFMLLLADLALAVMARSMPQLNVFVLGFAVKIVLGLTGLAMSVRFADAALDDLFEATFTYWERTASG
jgi:flagellar biosynthesis protein FliR